jgi:hypothetical protein
MLPERRHDISRLEAFSFFIPALGIKLALTPGQLPRIFAIYGAGFVVLFTMFALLYLQAYRWRRELDLTPLDEFDVRQSIGEHLVSAGVGLVAIAVALFTPMPFPVLSGFTYFLMGPAHGAFGVISGRRRRALEGNAAAAAV